MDNELADRVPPVMVLGCGRSGTSIFGELFEDLGPYRYLSEPRFDEVIRESGACAIKVPTEAEGFPADPGLSFPLDTLLEVHPEIVLFWIVRHPLDAISSLRVGISKDWSHHPRPPDWRDWLDRSLVERCAHHWAYINSLGFERVADRATLVRFEDLIEDPLAFAKRICSRLGLSVEAQDRALRSWSRRVQNTNNDEFVEAVTSRFHSRSDHTVRIGRWRENLSEEEAQVAVDLVREPNRRFGYDLSTRSR